MSIVLTASNSKYGVLSCNFKSPELGGNTLSEFVLTKIINSLNTDMVSQSDQINIFKNVVEQIRKNNMYMSKNMVQTDNEIVDTGTYINTIVKSKILKSYIEYNNLEQSYSKLSTREKDKLSDTLMGYYLKNEIPDYNFNRIIEEIIMELPTQDNSTIGEVFNDKLNSDMRNLTEMIINIMDEGINLRFGNADFVYALSSVDLDEEGGLNITVPETDDTDDLEKLNIFLLSKYKKTLQQRDLNIILQNISSAYTVSITNAFVKLLAGVRNYTRDVRKSEINLDDNNTDFILRSMFPSCNNLIAVNANIPSDIKDIIKSTEHLSNVSPDTLWKYIQRYIVVKINSDQSSSSIELKELYGKVYIIGDMVLSNNTLNIDNEMTRFIDSGSVKIYTMPGCKWCDKAKDLLNDRRKQTNIRGVKVFEEIQFGDGIKETIMTETGLNETDISFPVIVVNGKFIGGYTELEKIINKK